MKKYFWNIAFILLLGIGTFYFLINDTSQIENIEKLSFHWGIIAVSCIGLYWLSETIVQHLMIECIERGNKIWNSFKVVMIGHFFNAITPFATGGQPMQLFMMTKQGISAGTSASVLLSKFIIYQMILTLYSFVVLILQLKFFISHMSQIIYLSIIGFTVNLAVVVALIMVACMKKQTISLSIKIVEILHAMHFIKKPNKVKKNIIRQIAIFNDNIRELLRHKKLLISVSLLTTLQLTFYFIIPYTVYRGFGLSGANVFSIISASAFILMFSSFIPIPGGSGVAEGSFFLMFQIFFPKSILPLALLIWRLITFYMPLCLGGIIQIFSMPAKQKT